MSSDDFKNTFSKVVNRAAEYNANGDDVMMRQKLRNIEDLPLPPAYVCAALKEKGLLKYYKGHKS